MPPRQNSREKRKYSIATCDRNAAFDGTARFVMDCIEGRVSDKLYRDMMDYLLGFSDDMQLVIADNLLDAVCYGWEHYIHIPHIDTKMKSFYLLIEEEMTQTSN